MEVEIRKLDGGLYLFTIKVGGQLTHVGKAATFDEARSQIKAFMLAPIPAATEQLN